MIVSTLSIAGLAEVTGAFSSKASRSEPMRCQVASTVRSAAVRSSSWALRKPARSGLDRGCRPAERRAWRERCGSPDETTRYDQRLPDRRFYRAARAARRPITAYRAPPMEFAAAGRAMITVRISEKLSTAVRPRGVYSLTPRGRTAVDSFSEVLTVIIARPAAANSMGGAR